MFKVKNNSITITRGDSGIAEIILKTADGEKYAPIPKSGGGYVRIFGY